MAKVSIILAAYNGEATIKETIESILSQTFKDSELIVIDDGSSDKTAEVVKSFKDKRVKYFYQKNSGSPAGPRNWGIKEASGDFIGFCDQEDIYYPGKIEKQVRAYENNKSRGKIGIVISAANLIDKKGTVIAKNKVPFAGFLGAKESFEMLLRGDFITACSALIPKKIVDEAGGLDEKLVGVDDYDLWLRITKEYGILALREPLCAWRHLPDSLSADKSKLYKETEKVFAKLDSKVEEVKIGHGKNLMRIIVSLILAKQFKEAKKYATKASNYPISSKARFILKTFNLSSIFGFFLVKSLEKIGLVSL